jgi:hypothetical protein
MFDIVNKPKGSSIKASLLAPMYLSVSWVLTVSYQLFTETAVKSIATSVTSSWPAASGWLNANVDTLVFVYAFTWIFVLSSVIPSVYFGKTKKCTHSVCSCLGFNFDSFFYG